MSLVSGTGLALPGRLLPVDIDLSAGEIACLIGPNGSGKTSLLHALAGIGRPQGVVSIGGLDPARLPPSQRARLLSYLPATREIVWPLPVRDLVALGLGAATDAGFVEDALVLLDLEALADRRLDRLSTGERSRALIARALAPLPRLLLLDEPTANLDPAWQLRLMEQLRRIAREEECAILVALHDLDLAGRYGDRLLIMRDGSLVADGSPAVLLAGDQMTSVFGIERTVAGWSPIRLPEDRRSSP
jgi:iron complex transport system ATP-binding protein